MAPETGTSLLSIKKSVGTLLFYWLAASGLFLLICQDPFFWDTIQLGSKHAHFFLENGLKWQVLPEEIDSGHPPLLGFYLAVLWTLLGKSLFISHVAVFPFLLLNIWLTWRLGLTLNRNWGALLPLLVFADPVILTQHVLVSPDQIVMCGALLVMTGVLQNRFLSIVLGAILLCGFSMRGMITCAGLATWTALAGIAEGHPKMALAPKLISFLPGFCVAFAFLAWHQHATGWTGYHAGSPWAPAFVKVDFPGFLRNLMVLGWRWLDMGRFAELAIIAWIIQKTGWKESWKQDRTFWLLAGCLILALSPSALIYNGLSAHRYFIPAFLSVHLLGFKLLIRFIETQLRAGQRVGLALLILMGTGHFWVYPRGTSIDWDCTLQHRNYHTLRQAALKFADENAIPWNETGTAFPNLNTGENVQLNGDQRLMAQKNLDTNQYVLCSNVFNDFKKNDYQKLESGRWELLWSGNSGQVWMKIYRRKN